MLSLPQRMLWIVVFFFCYLSVAGAAVHHDLRVELSPDSHLIEVRDTLTLPDDAPSEWQFVLHAALAVEVAEGGATLTRLSDPLANHAPALYRLQLPVGERNITLSYSGKISHPIEQSSAGVGRTQESTHGFIAGSGVYLDGGSRWYPDLAGELVTYTLEARLPAGWTLISQGTRGRVESNDARSLHRWEEQHPQDEIYLVGGRFHEYKQRVGKIDTYVWLRRADLQLAERYLAAMGGYLDMYGQLLGPYPYAKFALVENQWESGYGMPSFTLLGPTVIRLPFILRSSFPHEILHNWWGNSVYVDYTSGNWSEGLTAYLADHLFKEQTGDGAGYRRNALQRYTNYVVEQQDFPLREFRGRHDDVSQAVGYDKSLMVFHMLRRQLGDGQFIAGLQRFYREQRFERAGWNDIRLAFEQVSGLDLEPQFQQWLQRPGIPALKLVAAGTQVDGKDYVLNIELEQTQAAPPFHVQVPLVVQLDNQRDAWQTVIDLNEHRQTVTVRTPSRPRYVWVDPEFDTLRRLDRGELPPSLGEALGAEKLLILLPSQAPLSSQRNYQRLALNWARHAPGVTVMWDKELEQLPNDQPVWLFGWENRYRAQLADSLEGQRVKWTGNGLSIEDTHMQRKAHSVVVVGRRPNAPVILWLGNENSAAFDGLARKLPHYGNYSYIAFQGNEPTNMLKGQWNVLDSPMFTAVRQADGALMPPYSLTLPPRSALAAGGTAVR